ncbi:MAG TPA: hypothetical protein GXX70_07990 [Tepidimicrobium sp.]|nr:hypothetical protein [Tepidimicrobium sp.]
MEEIIILIISIVAGIATYIVSNILKRGAVIASAIITLVSGLMLPYFFPSTGNLLATAAACASYAGMISVENALNLLEMAVISLMTGILFIAASNAYIGIGGRLGTIAAISCFAWLGFKKVFVGIDE